MKKYISKSIYLEYLECLKNAWLKMHRPDMKVFFEATEYEKHLSYQGYLVEDLARKFFIDVKGGTVCSGNPVDFNQDSFNHRFAYFFQPTFIHGDFECRSDIIEYDSDKQAWTLYEIKSTTSTEQNVREIDHIEDAAFQSIIANANGINISQVFVICLNKHYKLQDSLELEKLFVFDEVTDKVQARKIKTKIRMDEAKTNLMHSDENNVFCSCLFKNRRSQCKTFKYSHPCVSDYSVHDIARIDKTKLKSLIEQNCYELDEIPENFELSQNQKNQVNVYQSNVPMINYDLIMQELNSLRFPLYFLDYEAYSPAIPFLNGYQPYQRIPFQFSLHILSDLTSTPVHVDYLHDSKTDPSDKIIEKLKKYISPNGTIIVWYKTFECGIHEELAQRHPESEKFLKDLNFRVYDLMDIFKKQLFVHKGFKGSCSIKNVLPVMFPELSYKTLEVQEGTKASILGYKLMHENLDAKEKEKIGFDLKEYCKLDSYAMVAIYLKLMNLNNSSAEWDFNKKQATIRG